MLKNYNMKFLTEIIRVEYCCHLSLTFGHFTICQFVEKEICSGTEPIYPPSDMIFNVLNSTPFDKVKAVILGHVDQFYTHLLADYCVESYVHQ